MTQPLVSQCLGRGEEVTAPGLATQRLVVLTKLIVQMEKKI